MYAQSKSVPLCFWYFYNVLLDDNQSMQVCVTFKTTFDELYRLENTTASPFFFRKMQHAKCLAFLKTMVLVAFISVVDTNCNQHAWQIWSSKGGPWCMCVCVWEEGLSHHLWLNVISYDTWLLFLTSALLILSCNTMITLPVLSVHHTGLDVSSSDTLFTLPHFSLSLSLDFLSPFFTCSVELSLPLSLSLSLSCPLCFPYFFVKVVIFKNINPRETPGWDSS